MIDRNPTWNLDELTAQVALALSTDYVGAESGRVRDIPDARVIRYYTTLGLIDRPAELRGRTAMYSARHLAQIVAIKKMQARGQSLSQVQEVLTGIDDAGLARIAGEMKRGAESRIGDPSPVSKDEKKKKSRKSSAFWARPAEVEASAPRAEMQAESVSEDRILPAVNEGKPSASSPAPMSGLKLGERAMLLFEANRAPDPTDLEAIAAAAAPLLALLEKRGLLKHDVPGAANAPEKDGEKR